MKDFFLRFFFFQDHKTGAKNHQFEVWFSTSKPFQKTSNLNIKPSSDENWKKKDEKAVAPKKQNKNERRKKKSTRPPHKQ